MTVHSSLTANLPQSPDPNIPQRDAAIPERDVWVAASAGSGKTKVLTDRVLRLLLPDPLGRWNGSAPHRILCITFTKAAAAEMALRVQKKLGDWAVMDDDALAKDLEKLLGMAPSTDVMAASRTLFSKVLDVPSGLSIMTIHAFCQSTLGRFALEAGVTPGFTVIEEARARDSVAHIINDVIRSVENGESPDLTDSFTRIATYLDLDTLHETLLSILGKSREVKAFLAQQKKTSLLDGILDTLDYEREKEFSIPDDDILFFSRAFTDKGGKIEQGLAQDIATWLALSPSLRLENLSLLQNAFLTKADKKPRTITKAVINTYPDSESRRDWIVSVMDAYRDNRAKYMCAEQTADLMVLAKICLERYERKKREMNALDFNDLILKTRALLENQSLDWVHYKLDEGIDHILVDEAQDTNIHQWKIIEYLSDEFLSGQGDDTRLRSLFVVGDEKQSIFSFHGADPEAFQYMRSFFAERSKNAGRDFYPIALETSFRSSLPVLKLVDEVFESHDLSLRLGLQKGQRLTHYSHRAGAAGMVECWPLLRKPRHNNNNTPVEWVLPSVTTGESSVSESPSSSSALAGQIAMTIATWLQKGEFLPSEGRMVEPRDILVLVRTRTSFVPDLVRHLKLRGIAVSGADRMKLIDQIAVMDCLALARFARFPDDDVSLACLLRSPLIRISEDDLMTLALGRSGTLWSRAEQSLSATTRLWLQRAIEKSRTEKPFDFFDDMLNGLCPYADGLFSGWKAFATCLGADCLDPLDEFLTYCLLKEDDGIFSLEEFCAVMQKSDIEIKREAGETGKDAVNQVRIMTVHASKGLEAPIVFLPDTTSVPNRGKIESLQWIKSDVPIPLWAARKDDACQQYQSLKDESYDRALSEHMRLLYVALTRPRDRLYIMGETTKENLHEFSWYALVEKACRALSAAEDERGVLRLTSPQTESVVKENAAEQKPKEKVLLPDWAIRTVEEENLSRPRLIQPSRLSGDEGTDNDREGEELVRSPLSSGQDYRFQRGNLTHKLFQILPDIPIETREVAARKFLSRMGRDLPLAIQDDIINETLRILNDVLFADVFGKNAMAEVPIAGDMGDGRSISGQIDRLVIDINKILIVDFKTNRPSPVSEKDIPSAYRNQLRAYKTALSRIYPDRVIHCALLWTDQPLLMPVDV